jgi:hypothetical protein
MQPGHSLADALLRRGLAGRVLQVVATAASTVSSRVIAGIELWAMIAIGAPCSSAQRCRASSGSGWARAGDRAGRTATTARARALAALLLLFTLTRDWRSADWRGLCWALAARMPATATGVGWCGVCRSGHCTSSSASSCWPRWP